MKTTFVTKEQLEKIVDEYLDKYIAEDLASINLIKKAQMQLTQLTEEGTETFLEKFLNKALEYAKESGKTPDNIGVRDKFKFGNAIPIDMTFKNLHRDFLTGFCQRQKSVLIHQKITALLQ